MEISIPHKIIMSSTTHRDFDGVIRYQNNFGKLHREDGPAIIFPDGDTSWFYLGVLHRTDGPAIDWKVENRFVWSLHGKRLDVKTQEEFEHYLKLKAFW